MASTPGLAVRRLLGAAVLAALCSLAEGCGDSSNAPGSSTPVTVGVPAKAESVRIVYVIDGDTVIVRPVRRGGLLNEKSTVRLLEIDAPESKERGRPVDCFGRRSSRVLARLLPVGSVARVTPDRELRDRYGRTLLYAWNAHGVFVNERLVLRGFARAVLFEPNDRYIDVIRRAESEARAAGMGLWSACP